MSYPLRLAPELEQAARERAASIGISFNALIAVALDAYLRGASSPTRAVPRKPVAPAASPEPKGPYAQPGVERPAGEEYKDFIPEWAHEFFGPNAKPDPEDLDSLDLEEVELKPTAGGVKVRKPKGHRGH